jgi:hypothetical protein
MTTPNYYTIDSIDFATLSNPQFDGLPDGGGSSPFGGATSMSRFGNGSVAVAQNDRSESVLSVSFTNAYTKSVQKLGLKGYPLTLYEDGNGHYALAVIFQTNVSGSAETFFYCGTKFQLGINTSTGLPVTPDKYFLVHDAGGSDTATSSTLIHGWPLAVNAAGQMIMYEFSHSGCDQQERLYLGGMPLTIRRINRDWYLVVGHI